MRGTLEKQPPAAKVPAWIIQSLGTVELKKKREKVKSSEMGKFLATD